MAECVLEPDRLVNGSATKKPATPNQLEAALQGSQGALPESKQIFPGWVAFSSPGSPATPVVCVA
ncbi:MAG: hypothetical protein KatS3mg077_0384 [Candidatus Binatia bacterium]|nr:MAG: hypothetical protein KatS3mg077_0384 [Candidatus Binatia bacterium]